MDDEIRDGADYDRLREKFYASEGVRQHNAVLANQLSFYTYEANKTELLRAVDLHFELRRKRKLGDFDNKQPLHDYIRHVTRLLHNYLASAKTLADNTRHFVQDAYGADSTAFQEYCAEVKRRFDCSPVSKFTMDLRSQFTHVGLPFISSVRGGSEARGRDLFTMELRTEKLHGNARWTSLSKKYVADCGGRVDLELYVKAYDQVLSEFGRWLDLKVTEWGEVEREKMLALNRNLVNWEKRTFPQP